MSTIVVTNIGDGTKNVPSTVVTEGGIKAWVGEYNQSVPTTNDTYNISSITDVAAGLSTDNFTNNQGGTTYGIVGSQSNSLNPVGMNWATSDDKTTGLCDMRARNANAGTFSDAQNQNRAYMGDLA